jgi:hypothetical protein
LLLSLFGSSGGVGGWTCACYKQHAREDVSHVEVIVAAMRGSGQSCSGEACHEHSGYMAICCEWTKVVRIVWCVGDDRRDTGGRGGGSRAWVWRREVMIVTDSMSGAGTDQQR